MLPDQKVDPEASDLVEWLKLSAHNSAGWSNLFSPVAREGKHLSNFISNLVPQSTGTVRVV